MRVTPAYFIRAKNQIRDFKKLEKISELRWDHLGTRRIINHPPSPRCLFPSPSSVFFLLLIGVDWIELCFVHRISVGMSVGPESHHMISFGWR